jgi:hypothetical protein
MSLQVYAQQALKAAPKEIEKVINKIEEFVTTKHPDFKFSEYNSKEMSDEEEEVFSGYLSKYRKYHKGAGSAFNYSSPQVQYAHLCMNLDRLQRQLRRRVTGGIAAAPCAPAQEWEF